SEAFGFVQIEAMACGCPVINTNIPNSGVSWVSLHEESGLTIPMDDPEALAKAALRLLNEPGLHARLAYRARRRAAAEFGDETMAQRSLAIYQQVLGQAEAAKDFVPGPIPVPAFGWVSANPVQAG